jgi:hypothetical protein
VGSNPLCTCSDGVTDLRLAIATLSSKFYFRAERNELQASAVEAKVS